MKWKHFSALLPICAGISPVPGEFPTQRSVTRNFDVFFDLRLNKRLSGAGDLRRYRAHYDVTLMKAIRNLWCKNSPHRSLYCQWLGETSIIKIHPVLCFTWWLHQMETFSALLDLCECHWPLWGEPVTSGFSSQRGSNVEIVSIWWRHHDIQHRKTSFCLTTKKWPNAQIQQPTCHISHNAPFRTEMGTFLFWMVRCGIWDSCIEGFVRLAISQIATVVAAALLEIKPWIDNHGRGFCGLQLLIHILNFNSGLAKIS